MHLFILNRWSLDWLEWNIYDPYNLRKNTTVLFALTRDMMVSKFKNSARVEDGFMLYVLLSHSKITLQKGELFLFLAMLVSWQPGQVGVYEKLYQDLWKNRKFWKQTLKTYWYSSSSELTFLRMLTLGLGVLWFILIIPCSWE